MKREKIILFTMSFRKGGAENQLMKLVDHLQKTNEIKIYYFIEGVNDFKDICNKENVNIELLRFYQFYIPYLYIRKNKIKKVIAFMYFPILFARILRLITSFSLITSIRDAKIPTKYKFLFNLTKKVDTITTFNSITAYDIFLRNNIAVREKSVVVNNAIKFDTVSNKEYDSKIDIPVLLSIAHFRPNQKDYKTLFKALKLLNDEGVDFRMDIIGNLYGSLWPQKTIDEYNLNEKVNIRGFRDDVSNFIRNADIVILSTFWEGTPNALLEAMAHKKIVISSKAPGCTDLIEDSKGGFLFEIGNERELAERIKEVMQLEIKELRKISQRAFDYVRKNYDEEEVFKKWDELMANGIFK